MRITVVSCHDVSYSYRMIHGMACSFLQVASLTGTNPNSFVSTPSKLFLRSKPCARRLDLRRLKECCAPNCTVMPAYTVTKSPHFAGDSGRRSLAVTVKDPAGVRQLRLSRCGGCH